MCLSQPKGKDPGRNREQVLGTTVGNYELWGQLPLLVVGIYGQTKTEANERISPKQSQFSNSVFKSPSPYVLKAKTMDFVYTGLLMARKTTSLRLRFFSVPGQGGDLQGYACLNPGLESNIT